MLPFLRSDLAQFTAYTPHPGGADGVPAIELDHLDTNENPFELPAELKQKLAWTYQQEIQTNRYPDGSHHGLKSAIAQYVNESAGLAGANSIQPAHITVGNGSDELIRSVLIATCLGNNGAILVAEPTFSMYGILAQTLGIPVVSVARSATFAIDLTAAKAAITQTQNPPIRAIFVVHPNSPTANALTQAELDWLRSVPEQILVVIDEAYFEFSQTTVVPELAQRPNWLVMRTFSKAFRLAAHRVGYAIAHPELIATLEKVRLPYNLPSVSQAAAQVALTHRQQLLEVIPTILAERQQLWQRLAQHPALQVWPTDANFIYLRLRSEVDQTTRLAQICRELKARGTLIRHTGGGLRITVGSPAENQRTGDRLEAILNEIGLRS